VLDACPVKDVLRPSPLWQQSKKEATLCNPEWTWANGRDATSAPNWTNLPLSLSFYPPLIDWCRPFPPALLSHISRIDSAIPSAQQSTNEQDTQKQNENKKMRHTNKHTVAGGSSDSKFGPKFCFILKRTTCDAAL
jgi:hypothetical protein